MPGSWKNSATSSFDETRFRDGITRWMCIHNYRVDFSLSGNCSKRFWIDSTPSIRVNCQPEFILKGQQIDNWISKANTISKSFREANAGNYTRTEIVILLRKIRLNNKLLLFVIELHNKCESVEMICHFLVPLAWNEAIVLK